MPRSFRAPTGFFTVLLLGCCTLAQVNAPPPRPADAGLPTLSNASVSVPWSELRPLLERGKSAPEQPPVDYVFAPVAYTATVGAKTVKVTVTCEVTLLADKWILLPLGSTAAGVIEAKADGQPCPLVMRDGQLFALLKGQGVKKLALQMERDLAADGATTGFDLPLLPAPLVSVSTLIPQVGLNIHTPHAADIRATEKDQGTTLAASYRGGETITISWAQRPPQDQQPTKVMAQTLTCIAVDRGVLRCKALVKYEILHAAVNSFRINLPEGIEILRTRGDNAGESRLSTEGKQRQLVVGLKSPAEGTYQLLIEYEQRFKEDQASLSLPLLTQAGAAQDSGMLGIEVRGNYEITPAMEGMDRVDIKQLPQDLWQQAQSPLLFGYRYQNPPGKLSLALTRHQEIDVLVAMSDVCEASTTFTSDGKTVTKLMYVMRNNLKPFMNLRLPEGAQLWSALVEDRPVTPARNAKGEILIPLKKSEPVDRDDEHSYRARREQRRSSLFDQEKALKQLDEANKMADIEELSSDLKPYDVEIVYVMPTLKTPERGQITFGLPRCDIPTGQLAWAIFVPRDFRVVDTQGNLTEVNHFSLPFPHFGEAELLHKDLAKAAQAQQQLAMAKAEAAKSLEQMAISAKAQGVLPVRIEIPLTGEIHRFEKFLVVDEAPTMTLTYNRRPQQ